MKDGINKHQSEEIKKILDGDNSMLIMGGYNCRIKETGGEVTIVEVSKN